MSARNIAIMNAHYATLDQEQEQIAQFMATQPHSGGIHTQNYRKAASETNIKKQNELQTNIAQQLAIVKAELQVHVGQTQSGLKSEFQTLLNKSVESLELKIAFTDDNRHSSQEMLENDVKFVRHELKKVGERLTTINHMITNRNKELFARIEALEKNVLVLKTPPPKSEFQWFEFFMIIGFLVISFIGFFLKTSGSDLLMIGY
jgi:hypothetical protein